MLMRDLAAACCGRWREERGSFSLSAPLGSQVVISDERAREIVGTLSAFGPKALQAFTVAIELWWEQTKGVDPGGVVVQPLRRIARGLDGGRAGPCSSRLLAEVKSTFEALAALRFLSAPAAARGSGAPPGAPLVLVDVPHPTDICYRPGPPWVRELSGPVQRVAKLPRSFLSWHAKNDRYKILLSWYLAIMLRVNRKYGWHYRVTLRTLLQGAGIQIPTRNVTRFLSAIYRSLDALPDIGYSGPPLTSYSADAILSSKFEFWAEPALLVASRNLNRGV
jgi:hypothetical protein